jgi:hypothetical protein
MHIHTNVHLYMDNFRYKICSLKTEKIFKEFIIYMAFETKGFSTIIHLQHSTFISALHRISFGN